MNKPVHRGYNEKKFSQREELRSIQSMNDWETKKLFFDDSPLFSNILGVK